MRCAPGLDKHAGIGDGHMAAQSGPQAAEGTVCMCVSQGRSAAAGNMSIQCPRIQKRRHITGSRFLNQFIVPLIQGVGERRGEDPCGSKEGSAQKLKSESKASSKNQSHWTGWRAEIEVWSKLCFSLSFGWGTVYAKK